MMYFYYEMGRSGRWLPKKSENQPAAEFLPDFRQMVGIRLLGEDEAGLPLTELSRKYPAPGERNTERAASGLDGLIGVKLPVLDHGFVRVVDYMGNDSSIVQMARVSYGDGTKSPSDDRSLIRYLMRHEHTSPFEGCEIKLHVKLPIYIARQWIRHRTANVNEVSGRYSVLKDEFHLPNEGDFRKQSKTNKQGRDEADEYTDSQKLDMRQMMASSMEDAFAGYNRLTSDEYDLSREQARIFLPLSTYTEWYWKIDLHNLFHFLRLRADSHAQKEIRDYAQVIENVVQAWVPLAFEAYVDYKRDAVKLSRMEIEALWTYFRDANPQREDDGWPELTGASAREEAEFHKTLGLAP